MRKLILVERKTASRKGLTPRQWVKIRKISQLIFLAVFLVIFLWSRREFYLNPSLESGFKEKLVNLPLKLDPLVMIAQSLASRKVLAGSLLAIITLVISALVGRVWCGWFCPMGTVLDWFPLRTWKKNKPAGPERYRGIKYILLMVILFAAGLGNLSLLIFDPLRSDTGP
ncbi:MAG: 4Fe-4S binding protein [Anaerolineales bacterium]|nr:MAG: 4Fe-4S binding protein [Anaerolineales bacterium]